MALSKLLQKVKSIKAERTYEDSFLAEYDIALLGLQENRPVPTDRFRPSGLADGCCRMIWYQRKGLGENEGNRSAILCDICENGTDRHTKMQRTIQLMEGVQWLDVEEVCVEAREKGLNTTFLGWDKEKVEAKCHNADMKINFLCDGVLRYKGKDILLEIKTIHQFGFDKLVAPLQKHIRQVACYSMALGLDEVLFMYEDRNFLKKKLFLYKVTDEDKKEVLDKIDYINECLVMNITPPREEDKCLYCDRKSFCRFDQD